MNKPDLSLLTPYILQSCKELFTVPPPEEIVKGVLPKGSITGLTSYPGRGKTWLALELARSISTGTPFLSHFETIPGNVVFVGQDASIFDYARQLRKLIKDESDKYDIEVDNDLRTVNPFDDRFHALIQPDILFEDHESIRRLAKTVNEITHSERVLPRQIKLAGSSWTWGTKVEASEGTDLVIFDTLSAMTRANQNDNTEMERVFRILRWFSNTTGAAVFLLHHNSKPNMFNQGEDWRGAMAQIGALDNWFNLVKPPRSAENRLRLQIKKYRGLKPEDFSYILEIDETTARLTHVEDVAANEAGDDPETINVEFDDPQDTVLQFLADHRGEFFNATQIADALWPTVMMLTDASQSSWRRRVQRLIPKLLHEQLAEEGPRSSYRLREIRNEDSSSD